MGLTLGELLRSGEPFVVIGNQAVPKQERIRSVRLGWVSGGVAGYRRELDSRNLTLSRRWELLELNRQGTHKLVVYFKGDEEKARLEIRKKMSL